jgi:DtxR family Mn-dependent transcriptional regulator
MIEKKSEISATLEDYLETIFTLSTDKGYARSKDIAEHFQIKTSSVTAAMRSLAEKGLITYEPYSVIQLTPKGKKVASCINSRHSVLKRFFTDILQLSAQEAEECACSMEHGLTPKLCDRLSHLDTLIKETPDFSEKLSVIISHTHLEKGCSSNCKCS